MTLELDIVSIGMVTAVGLDAPSSCAAMRARLAGFQETRFLGPGGESLVGAPVPLPRTWIGEKRLAHMAAAAICEAFDPVPEAQGTAALILCLAEEGRPGRLARDPARFATRIAEITGIASPHRTRIVVATSTGSAVAVTGVVSGFTTCVAARSKSIWSRAGSSGATSTWFASSS